MQLQAMTPEEVRDSKIYQEWGLTDQEYDKIQSLLGRLPNYTETGLYAVMWSEHCSYKNSKPILKQFYTEGPQVLQGPGEGAGIIDIGDEQAVVFKAESHNHPSAVEPYEGAATGVGGILRDIFSMGAQPIAVLDALFFGELNDQRTKEIVSGVVDGIGGYGNSIGIPTVGGMTKFDSAYKGNPLVNAMCVGLIDHKDIQKGQAKGLNNSIMYVGAKTGRDGIHGATFASDEFSEKNESQRSAIQVGDPFMEKLLMDACLDLIRNHSDLLVGIQDMGAAGLVSSSSEMASKANSGLELYLDDVPQRETEMTPYEILLSESQERMLICVKKGQEQRVTDLFARYGLEAVICGRVVEGHDYKVFQAGELVADIPVDTLAEDAPVYENQQSEPERMQAYRQADKYIPQIDQIKERLFELLLTADLADKEPLYQRYDSQVRTSTVVGPGSDAAVVRIRGTQKALAMTTDCNSRYIYLDPEKGGAIAVAEAARNIVASGGRPLGITDCLNYGNPKDPEIFYEFAQAAKGITTACRRLETPVISGNVSLYNENQDGAVYPTPMIGMVGLIDDLNQVLRQQFNQAGDLIYLIGQTKDDYSGSLIQKLETGQIAGLIDFDLEEEAKVQDFVYQANQNRLLAAAHDISEGGLAVALMQMALKTPYAFEAHYNGSTAQLFSESQSRFVVTITEENQAKFEALAEDAGIVIEKLGQVEARDEIVLASLQEVAEFKKSEIEGPWRQQILELLKY